MNWLVALDALTLAALVACSNGTLRVYAEGSLKPPTLTAIDAWEQALDRGPCPVDLYWSTDADVVVRFGQPRDGGRGGYLDGVIRVRPDVPPIEREMVIAHELGHALGFGDDQHAPNEEELMYPKQPGRTDPEPDGWDVAFVCEAR